VRFSSAVGLLQALVRIPSVNPSGTPGDQSSGEKECAEFVAEFLGNCGAQCELREVQPNRPNVIGFFPGSRRDRKRLLFAPHTDTVSVTGMTIDPFAAELRDGRVYGRGASDTKGPMAAMLWALWESRANLAALDHEIWFAGFMGEEAGQDGSRAFAQEEKVDFAIIGEPTNLQIVHTHKGAVWITVTTHGKSVHASTPDQGENAIYEMSDIIQFIRDDLLPQLATMSDSLLGSPTISVGTCAGGSKINIVPDRCRLEVDMRTIPGQDTDFTIARLREQFPQAKMDVWQARPLWTDPRHPLVRALEETGAKCVGAPWFCDAAVLSEAGIPAVALGPGSIAQAHTEDEWIAVDDLNRGVDFYVKFLSAL
jgi:acetylornithine deacetylase/succinyl-diaminopimelate desuccinylase-like protein